MAEYVEREALIDTMQAALDALPKGAFNPNKIGFAAAIEGVKNFPTADVRPVVLCRDCKCYQQSHYIDNHMECARSGFPVHSVDFCSLGEKREES